MDKEKRRTQIWDRHDGSMAISLWKGKRFNRLTGSLTPEDVQYLKENLEDDHYWIDVHENTKKKPGSNQPDYHIVLKQKADTFTHPKPYKPQKNPLLEGKEKPTFRYPSQDVPLEDIPF